MKLIASSSYLPNKIVMNKELSEKLGVTEEFIEKRTGIKQRYFTENETIEEMAIKATEKLIEKTKISIETIDLIIVATTSTNKIMPGISNYVQKELKIPKCICLDILAGCAGYINAVDIAQLYMKAGKVKRAIIIGADILSESFMFGVYVEISTLFGINPSKLSLYNKSKFSVSLVAFSTAICLATSVLFTIVFSE